MAGDTTEEDEWVPRFRVDEELDFFTDLALHETERWIQAVTKMKLSHPDDLRCSLQNGVILCELVNGLEPGSVSRINRLNTPIAGLDNLALFLKACQQKFGLRQPQLFDPLDLEDLSQRAAFSDENPVHLKQETDRRLRNVALTVYWLGQVAKEVYSGPHLDQSAFSGLVTQNPGVLSPDQSPQRKSYHSPYSGSSYSVRKSRNSNSNFGSSGTNLSVSRQSNNSVLNSSNYSNNSDLCSSPQSNNSDLYASQRSDTTSPLGLRDLYASQRSDTTSPLGLRGGHVACEASYDSTDQGSDGGHSLEAELLDTVDMSHHSSTSNLSRWGHTSPVYSNHDTNNSMYRSSPNLAQGLHNLSSSTDSLDGGHGFHSRQSSGSMENYSTRRLSSSSSRPGRPSVSANALQFVKIPGSNPLAQTAQKQIEIAEESKKIKWDTLVETTEDNDWQSKLGNWKSKRRTKSSASYDRKEETEAEEKENEEKALRSTKTFKEIVQKREKHKSLNSYPIEDENDEYTANNHLSDINHNRTESARSMQSSGSLDDSLAFDSSAPWAASSDDDTFKRDNRVGNGIPSESDTESNKENWTEHDKGHINNNNNTEYSTSSFSQKLSEQKNTDEKNVESQKPKSNKLSNLLRAYEEQTESDIEYKPLSRCSPQKSIPVIGQTSIKEEPKISPRSPRSEKDSVEKSITISQKPNSEKGFGFTFTGGRDLSQPIVIERVSLGGAADVCEVRVKDELLEINRRKVATYSHTQVEDLIKRAVRTGKLELKVKRFIRKGSYLSDEFSEGDSFDRFEEQMEREQEMKSNSKNEHSALTPMMDSLLREKHDHNSDNRTTEWDEPMQEDEETDRQTGQGYEERSYSPEPVNVQEEELHLSDRTQETNDYSAEIEAVTYPSQEEVDTDEDQTPSPIPEREASPVQRQQSHLISSTYKHTYTPYSPDSDYKPASVITAESGKPISFDVSLPVNREPPPDNTGFGPPQALLRWQRRPRSQYEDEPEEKIDLQNSANQTQFSVDINQSTSKSQPSELIEDDQEIRATFVPRQPLDLSREIKRMEEWDRKQEQKRQPDVTMSTDQNQEQREFEENMQAINSRWQSDQQKALITEQENKRKDELILSEERKRVAEMEQRKSERRAKRQAQMAELSLQEQSSQPPSNQQVSRPQPQLLQGRPKAQIQGRPQVQESSELVLQISGQRQYGGIQIDPVNRPDLTMDTHDRYAEVNFKVNINKQPVVSSNESSKLTEVERERERLQQEEAAMRRRIEEEKAAEDKRLREREEQIKRQEERLRQEEERLRFEQERLQRERQQHLQTVSLSTQRGESPASISKLSPSYQSSSPSSLSPPFNSQPEADQQFSSTVVIANSSPNNYYVKSVQHAPYQRPFTSSALNKREDKPSERLTREDLMAMSRSARPLEEKPPSLQQEEQPASQTIVSQVKKSVSQSTPVVREAPSKQEKHSLNAVPKPRLLDSKGWMNQEEREPPKQAAPRPARRSDIMKKQYTSPKDHWLVQEAERRRLEEQSYNGHRPNNHQYKNGPIKPHESLTTNRWRESGSQYNRSKAKSNLKSSTSFEQMRQKFSEQPNESQPLRPTNAALQPRAAPRQMSNGSLSARGDSPSWQSKNSANPSYMGRNSPRGEEINRSSPKPAPRSRSTPTAPGNSPEPTMAVSGRQRCSHCKEELGYGAAMVIESLNLHYHMQCFRCCVCRTQLGNGAEGADVRVRGWKLHCRNCYSNDEAGLKFSKV